MTTILVVDDNPENRYYLQALLRGHGHEVQVVEHGRAALDAARSSPPQVVISDLLMPVMDGYTLLRQWKTDSVLSAIPFIVYTATYTDADDERLARDLGADAFILKPAEPDDFLSQLDAVMAAAEPARPSFVRSDVPDAASEHELLQHYSEALIRKLEERSLQLEEVNAALEADIAARERIEAQLRRQARLLDQTSDAIAVHDLEHRVLYWSKGAERLHGWSAEEAVGASAADLHCPDVSQLERITAELLEHGSWNGELRLVDRSGAALVVEGRWTLIPGDSPGEQHLLAVHTDVTQRRKVEAQFLRAQRLESIGSLAGGIAHDLNNLLAPIVTGAEMLADRIDEPESRRILDGMAASAMRGAEMLRQVLSFARGIDGERKPVAIAEVVDEIVSIASTSFPGRISLTASVAPDVWTIDGDATQLHQVLLNLCVNARDALADGGHVTITADNVQLTEPRMMGGHEASPGRYVSVKVADDGCGIAPDLLVPIFEPFMTTKESQHGSGLGLSTVLGIVRSHGGFVDVESAVGVGSTFEVLLPASLALVESAREANASPAGSRTHD